MPVADSWKGFDRDLDDVDERESLHQLVHDRKKTGFYVGRRCQRRRFRQSNGYDYLKDILWLWTAV